MMEEDDYKWLIFKLGFSEDDLGKFIERVGIRIDSGISIESAREITFNEIMEIVDL